MENLMKKILFLAIFGVGFFGVDAQAGIFNFKKKAKISSSGGCASCCNSKAGSDVAGKSDPAPQKKVEAPSPVKAPDAPKGQSPAPVKAPGKKVAAPQQ